MTSSIIPVGAGRAWRACSVVLVLMLGAAGCVVQDERPMAPVVAQKATAEIPQAELLDVGVRMFDPNIPPDPAEQEKRGIYPDVRKAESRYMPVLLRDTLESTGQWGQVRVLPAESSGSDVNIGARIIESDGSVLQLAVTVTDATGRTWLRKDYEGLADTRAYKDVPVKPRDPFDNVYATIANDLLAARSKLTRDQRAALENKRNDETGLKQHHEAGQEYLSSVALPECEFPEMHDRVRRHGSR